MKITQYLTIQEVLELHRTIVKSYGGSDEVVDIGVLDAALHRCRSRYYETIFEQAAALFQSLCLGEAFVEKNESTAFVSALIFLRLNGYWIEMKSKEVVRMFGQIVERKIKITEIAKQFENNLAADEQLEKTLAEINKRFKNTLKNLA